MSENDEVLEKARRAIPAEIRLLSGCKDDQTSADITNVHKFRLPDPAGRAGGACTSAFLKVVYADYAERNRDALQQMFFNMRGALSKLNLVPDEDSQQPRNILSFDQVLQRMRNILADEGFTQVPQLSSSRPLSLSQQFNIVPTEGHEGTRRAVLIGINYVGKQGELSGCHNDVKNMKLYIKDIWDFEEENITVLMDDRDHTEPTHANILNAFERLVFESDPGDIAFIHFSGHGYEVPDENGDEEDGFDEAIVPVDYQTASLITDDEIFEKLVLPLASGVIMTVMMDCCHSGTVLDLPFIFKADDGTTEMRIDRNFKFEKEELDTVVHHTFGSVIALIVRWFTGKAEENETLSFIMSAVVCLIVAFFHKPTVSLEGDGEESDDKKNN